MQRLAISTVRKWVWNNQAWCPTAINYYCPFCKSLTTFPLKVNTYDNIRKAIFGTAECPGCQQNVHFLIFDPATVRDTSQKAGGELYMHPSFAHDRIELKGLDQIPVRIRDSYDETIRVYKSGSWNATSVMCRKVLEGLLVDKLDADELKGDLYKRIEKLESHADILSSLKSVFHTVREGGNFGAHFDLNADADEETAAAMLDFISFLIEFLYLIPKSADDLSAKLKEINKKDISV